MQAKCTRLQEDLQEASEQLGSAVREAERASVHHEAVQKSRDATAAQVRAEEVAAVCDKADR